MKKQLKKLLCAALSLSMVATSVVLPTTASAESLEWSADAGSWKFDLGSTENVADGYIGVSADTQYNATQGYGFIGLENGFATDWLVDGFEMTQGYDLTLENGARETVATADDDFVACTFDKTIGTTGMLSPIRFAMKSPENSYYKVKITMQRADVSKEASVSLFTERRHQHLLNEPIPEEGLVYEASVYVHNLYGKSNGSHPGNNSDTMLNVVALGENVAVSSIEVEKTEQGKTVFVLTDSTGCEQSAAIPYFPLDHCQGTGSALAKYLGSDWALVNEGESGLASSDAVHHFNNCVNDIKEGDVVYFQFGHNDAKGSGVTGYSASLENYYKQVTDKGAYFVIATPIQRKMDSQFNATDNTWSHTLAEYTGAAKTFVDAKLAAGATNIAWVNVNDMSIDFLNGVSQEINPTYNYGWQSANFYYYLNDYTHPNDYGADNFAKIFVDGANDIIEAAKAEDADASTKTQAAVLSVLLDGQREGEAERVPESIYSLGKVPNSAYPAALTKVVYYDYPWLLKKVTWNEDGTAASITAAPVACDNDEIPSLYCKGVIEVFTADGTSKGKIVTGDFLDKLNGEATLTFSDTTVTYDAAAGDTYKAYMIDSEIGVTEETVVSNLLTEKDNIDVKDYLIQGSIGTENIEDFSSYSTIEKGGSILNTNGFTSAGSVEATLGEEDGKYFASVTKGDPASSHYMYKSFSQAVSSGKFYFAFDVRYKSGVVSLEFTDGSKAPNSFPPLHMPIVIKSVDGSLGVYLSGELVTEINANEWVSVAYTMDMDNGIETATVNGVTKEKAVPSFQTISAPSPSKFAAWAIVETTKNTTIEYDITNIVAATLNVNNLEQKTVKVSVAEECATMGSVYVGEESTTEKTVDRSTMVTAVASPAEGYEFAGWTDSEGNTVSFAEIFEIRMFEDMDITASFKASEYDPITYLYKEGFNTLTTTTLAGGGWTSKNAQGNVTIESEATEGIGNYLRFGANSNSRGGNKEFGETYTSDKGIAFTMNTKFTKSSGDPNEIVVHGGNITYNDNNLNYGCTGGYVLSLKQTNDGKVTINEQATDIPNDTWFYVQANCDFATHKVKVKATSFDGKTEYFNGEVDMADASAKGVSGIYYKFGKSSGGSLSMDNIKIYTADQLPPEPVKVEKTVVIGEPVINEGTVSLSITNNSENAADVRMIVASYDANGVLINVAASEKTGVAAAEEAGVEGKGTVVEFTAPVTTDNYKILLWESIESMIPFAAPIVPSAE